MDELEYQLYSDRFSWFISEWGQKPSSILESSTLSQLSIYLDIPINILHQLIIDLKQSRSE